jgi:hypothetical protein
MAGGGFVWETDHNNANNSNNNDNSPVPPTPQQTQARPVETPPARRPTITQEHSTPPLSTQYDNQPAVDDEKRDTAATAPATDAAETESVKEAEPVKDTEPAKERHAKSCPAPKADRVTAVVLALPFVEVVSTRHAWYDPAGTVETVGPLTLGDALPRRLIKRLLFRGRHPLCTLVVMYPDVRLKSGEPRRDHRIEFGLAHDHAGANEAVRGADDCSYCGGKLREIIVFRVPVAGMFLAHYHDAAFRIMTRLFNGTIGAAAVPTAAVLLEASVKLETSADDFLEALSSNLKPNRIIGCPVLEPNGDAVRQFGFETRIFQAAGTPHLQPLLKDISTLDARTATDQEVYALPSSCVAMTRSQWQTIMRVRLPLTNGETSEPLLDSPPSHPDTQHLIAKLLSLASSLQGALHYLLNATHAMERATATALRGEFAKFDPLHSAVIQAELASSAASKYQKDGRVMIRYAMRLAPFVEPLQEVMRRHFCTRATNKIFLEVDEDLPSLVATDGRIVDVDSNTTTSAHKALVTFAHRGRFHLHQRLAEQGPLQELNLAANEYSTAHAVFFAVNGSDGFLAGLPPVPRRVRAH